MCDGQIDCQDGEDEAEANCAPPAPPKPTRPSINTFQCNDGRNVDASLRCNGRIDCSDGSDETDCPGYGGGLILKTYPDDQTIQQTREVVFQCRDEGITRAPVRWVRDNGRRLPPGSTDVRGRLTIPNIQVDHSGTYHCEAQGVPSSTPGRTKSVYLQVNPYVVPTVPPTLQACTAFESTCMNGQCIPKEKVCDGVYDCRDTSDEMRCNPLGCEPNEFQCDNKKCVLKTWLCDSDDDCGDGSDEETCPEKIPGSDCNPNEFACIGGNQCIPKSFHCDGDVDCQDGTDELGCKKPVVIEPPRRSVMVQILETFTLTCTVIGVPTPIIIWRLNWGHVPSKCRMISEDGKGTLICPSAQPTDQGAYSCEAINSRGSVFAQPDAIVQVKGNGPAICLPPQFNQGATTPQDCLTCFCFGVTDKCYSTERIITQLPPPLSSSFTLVGVNQDQIQGNYVIRNNEYPLSPSSIVPTANNGVQLSVDRSKLKGPSDLIVYFSLPESHIGEQLTTYGGFLRYKIRYQSIGAGKAMSGPDVIIKGNSLTLMYVRDREFQPTIVNQVDVEFTTGQWFKRGTQRGRTVQVQEPASRGEIMMALADVEFLLIRALYNDGHYVNSTLYDVQLDTAVITGSTQSQAVYVEECRCPQGYVGLSCQDCAPNYRREQVGPWLGRCLPVQPCRANEYGDPANGIQCLPCPCPLNTPTNQFSTSCYLASDGQVNCNCRPGYQGRRCQYCATGYTGNPNIPGDSCQPAGRCNPEGSLSADPLPDGRCQCKIFATGPECDQCKANSFYLNKNNNDGCIRCFCMGITLKCSSSNWYRQQEAVSFTNNPQGFDLVDRNQKNIINSSLYVDLSLQELSFTQFSRVGQEVLYWRLPNRFLGNKVSSYGGNLTYSLRYVPAQGGQSSTNSAHAVEIFGNDITLRHYIPQLDIAPSQLRQFSVPLYEQDWERQNGMPSNREHFMMALADLQYILIKATYTTNTDKVALKDVTLDYAEPRNTGQARAYAVEMCECPRGYQGLSCEDCDIGFTRSSSGIHLGTCIPCDCSGNSNECHPETGICLNCRDNTDGKHCERCAPGYSNYNVGGCRPDQQTCNCDTRGSVSCDGGRCQCKGNVYGDSCNSCKRGFFHLSKTNPDGCMQCWCSGVTTECYSSNYYRIELPMQLFSDHGFSFSNRLQTNVIRDGFSTDQEKNEISFTNFGSLGDSETYYWSLPQMFTGNRLASYGGNLTVTQWYQTESGGDIYADSDIIIRSAGGREFIWMKSKPLEPNSKQPYSVLLTESSFTMNQQPATREEFLEALSSVEAILIRATLSNRMRATYLQNVIMDTAMPSNTGQPRALEVEQCQCPLEYTGLSCEQCKPGHYRDLATKRCVPCPCNGRGESCTQLPNGSVRCDCFPGYYGPYCSGSVPPVDGESDLLTVSVTVTEPIIKVTTLGSTVEFHCSAVSLIGPQNRVSVTWSKADGELPYGRSTDNRQGLLIIEKVRASDGGTYICAATDGLGNVVSRNATLTIRGGGFPRVVIEEQREVMEVRVGGTLSVHCSAVGSPRPHVTWSRGTNRDLPPNVFQQNGVLSFHSAQPGDSGEYYCTATNDQGTDYARIIINVVRRDRPPTPTPVVLSEPKVDIRSGETVRVTCSAAIPGRFVIKWSRLADSLPSQTVIDEGELQIPNAQPVDSGIYVCRITEQRTQEYYESSTRIIIIARIGGGAVPTVRVQPERQTISQGNNVELRCLTSGEPRPVITWSKVNENIGPGVTIEGAVLRITNTMVSDRGMYVCTAQNEGGSAQAAAIVEVERREPPVIEVYPEVRQTIVVGASALFQCHLTAGIPNPTVRWSRTDGRPLTTNTETLNGGVLRFNQVQGDEEGSYMCTAENDAGSVTAIAILEVQSMPSITIRPGPSPYTVQAGERVRLECSAQGDPAPAVSWQRLLVNFSSNIPSRSVSPTVAVYEIGSVSKSDEGTYQCSARNAAGVSEKRIQVVVHDNLPGRVPEVQPRPPNPDRDVPGSTIIVPYGGSSEFTCSSHDPNADNLEYSFRRSDGRALPPSAVTRDGVMYLSNVDETASGEYACVGADRISGSILFTIYYIIEVLAPPRINLDPARQFVRPGDLVQIRCSATGSQPITITWSKETGYMPQSVIINGGELTFRGIKTTDAGRYTCFAVNSAGTAKAMAEVIVNEEPILTAMDPDVTLYVGQSAELRCEMSGINPNDVRWSRIGGRLPLAARPFANVLRLPRVQPEDSGNYQCEAITPAGTMTSDVIKLTIQRQRQVNIRVRSIPPRVRIGEDVELICDVEGDPTTAVSWTRVDGPMPREARIGGNILRLPRVQTGGSYMCTITTPQGVFEKNYGLVIQDFENIQYGPDLHLRSVTTRSVALGQSVAMDCRVSLPGPVSFTWTKQGGSLPFKAVTQDTMLDVPDVGVDDAGLYVCTGRNNERSVDLPTLLIVTGVVPRFEEKSYLSLATLPRAYLIFDIEISFKPESLNGLLLYNSQRASSESGDYVALGLKGGYAEFRFDVGSGPAVIRSRSPLALDQWHTIKISRNRKEGTMVVDGGEAVMGSSVGKFAGLDLVEPLYLGGAPDFSQLPTQARFTSGFRGCISRLVIGNNRNHDFVREARAKVGVTACDTCGTSPCQNNGVCQEAYTEVGHKCFCPAGFSGSLCENSGESCYPGVCGTGRCVNKPGGFECYCPFGKLGQRCEQDITIYEPAFADESYIAYPTPRARRWFSVDINFKPESLEDGVLMYCAQKESGPGDFASLAIRNKRLEFRYNTGSGTAKIQSDPIQDGQWIEVRANRTDRLGSMKVNDGPMLSGESPGSTRGLNLLTPLFVGGVDTSRIQISPEVEVVQGFRGCVSQIKLMGQEVPLSEALVDSANVDQCGGSVCSRSPCRNHGQCRDDPATPAGYVCSCPEGYSGHDCENEPGVCTLVQPCRNRGACIGTGPQYTCHCPLGFSGQHCEHVVDIRNTARFSGDSWVEFNQSMLLQESDTTQTATFEFTTGRSDGLLFWLGQETNMSGRGQDYISVAVKGGYIEFSYELGAGPAVIRSAGRVDDGRRHRLIVQRMGQEGSLTLDGNLPQRATSPGQLHMLNSMGNLYVGGVPDYEVMTGGSHTQGFTGCLHHLSLGSLKVDSYMDLALSGVNVIPCQRYRGGKTRGQRRG